VLFDAVSFQESVWSVQDWRNDADRRKPIYLGGGDSIVTMSTTNPTWTDLGLKPGLCCKRPVTKHHRHGMTIILLLLLLLLEALQLQRSFGLLNEFLPSGPVSDAVL